MLQEQGSGEVIVIKCETEEVQLLNLATAYVERIMLMKTLIVFAHTYFSGSRVNRALLEKASSVPQVTMRNLTELYGSDTGKIDVPLEQKYLEENDRIIFQCPVFWFNLPPMLKAYMDAVFTHGWAYGSTGHALQGKTFQLALSTGSPVQKYEKPAATIEELFKPVLYAAQFVGMNVSRPFVTYGCLGLSDEGLAEAAAAYGKILQS